MTNLEFPPEEFDAWAASYDQSTSADAGFPFDGYSRVLQTVVEQAAVSAGDAVLDLGAGTGSLSLLLAEQGAQLWCLDFSGEMLARARLKLPQSHFAQSDVRGPWPAGFQRRYHAIVSGYTFHHFPLDEKVRIIERLLHDHLLPSGRLVIGDLAFAAAAAQDAYRLSLGDEWDQEYYWLADESLAALGANGIQAVWLPVSPCAGVFAISAPGERNGGSS